MSSLSSIKTTYNIRIRKHTQFRYCPLTGCETRVNPARALRPMATHTAALQSPPHELDNHYIELTQENINVISYITTTGLTYAEISRLFPHFPTSIIASSAQQNTPQSFAPFPLLQLYHKISSTNHLSPDLATLIDMSIKTNPFYPPATLALSVVPVYSEVLTFARTHAIKLPLLEDKSHIIGPSNNGSVQEEESLPKPFLQSMEYLWDQLTHISPTSSLYLHFLTTKLLGKQHANDKQFPANLYTSFFAPSSSPSVPTSVPTSNETNQTNSDSSNHFFISPQPLSAADSQQRYIFIPYTPEFDNQTKSFKFKRVNLSSRLRDRVVSKDVQSPAIFTSQSIPSNNDLYSPQSSSSSSSAPNTVPSSESSLSDSIIVAYDEVIPTILSCTGQLWGIWYPIQSSQHTNDTSSQQLNAPTDISITSHQRPLYAALLSTPSCPLVPIFTRGALLSCGEASLFLNKFPFAGYHGVITFGQAPFISVRDITVQQLFHAIFIVTTFCRSVASAHTQISHSVQNHLQCLDDQDEDDANDYGHHIPSILGTPGQPYDITLSLLSSPTQIEHSFTTVHSTEQYAKTAATYSPDPSQRDISNISHSKDGEYHNQQTFELNGKMLDFDETQSILFHKQQPLFPTMVWNYLPASAGSLIHPHFQTFVENFASPQVSQMHNYTNICQQQQQTQPNKQQYTHYQQQQQQQQQSQLEPMIRETPIVAAPSPQITKIQPLYDNNTSQVLLYDNNNNNNNNANTSNSNLDVAEMLLANSDIATAAALSPILPCLSTHTIQNAITRVTQLPQQLEVNNLLLPSLLRSKSTTINTVESSQPPPSILISSSALQIHTSETHGETSSSLLWPQTTTNATIVSRNNQTTTTDGTDQSVHVTQTQSQCSSPTHLQNQHPPLSAIDSVSSTHSDSSDQQQQQQQQQPPQDSSVPNTTISPLNLRRPFATSGTAHTVRGVITQELYLLRDNYKTQRKVIATTSPQQTPAEPQSPQLSGLEPDLAIISTAIRQSRYIGFIPLTTAVKSHSQFRSPLTIPSSEPHVAIVPGLDLETGQATGLVDIDAALTQFGAHIIAPFAPTMKHQVFIYFLQLTQPQDSSEPQTTQNGPFHEIEDNSIIQHGHLSSLGQVTTFSMHAVIAAAMRTVLYLYYKSDVVCLNMMSYSAPFLMHKMQQTSNHTTVNEYDHMDSYIPQAWQDFPLSFTFVARPSPFGIYTNDCGPLERLAMTSVVSTPPEMYAQDMRNILQQQFIKAQHNYQ